MFFLHYCFWFVNVVHARLFDVHGVELAIRSNSPADGAAAEFIGLGDERGHEENIVDDGEKQNGRNHAKE